MLSSLTPFARMLAVRTPAAGMCSLARGSRVLGVAKPSSYSTFARTAQLCRPALVPALSGGKALPTLTDLVTARLFMGSSRVAAYPSPAGRLQPSRPFSSSPEGQQQQPQQQAPSPQQTTPSLPAQQPAAPVGSPASPSSPTNATPNKVSFLSSPIGWWKENSSAVKRLFKDYGGFAVGVYLSVYVCTLLLLYLIVSAKLLEGPDVNEFINSMRLKKAFIERRIEVPQEYADFATAWVLTKTTEPIRLVVTLALVPFLVRRLPASVLAVFKVKKPVH